MNSLFKILLDVITYRVENGEKLDTIFLDYPKLTADEQNQIKDIIVEQRIKKNLQESKN